MSLDDGHITRSIHPQIESPPPVPSAAGGVADSSDSSLGSSSSIDHIIKSDPLITTPNEWCALSIPSNLVYRHQPGTERPYTPEPTDVNEVIHTQKNHVTIWCGDEQEHQQPENDHQQIYSSTIQMDTRRHVQFANVSRGSGSSSSGGINNFTISPSIKLNLDWSVNPYLIDYHSMVRIPALLPASSVDPHDAAIPDFLTSMPSDCLYNILLLLDGTALASLSSCSLSLERMSSGADLEHLWREVARKDYLRLSLPERKSFDSPPTSQRRASSTLAKQLQAPRTLYLLRLKQRSLARAASRTELRRVQSTRVQVLELQKSNLNSEIALESSFMIGTFTLMLLSALFLLFSDSFLDDQYVWVIFAPLWLALIGTIFALWGVHRLRTNEENRQKMNQPIPSTTTAATTSPASPSLPCLDVTSSTASMNPSELAAIQRQRREQSNTKFLMAARAAAAPVREGPLQGILDSHFSSTYQTCITSMKILLILTSSILLCLKESVDVPQFHYRKVATPIWCLFAFSFIQPFYQRFGAVSTLPNKDAQSTFISNLRNWLLWIAPLLVFLVLLVCHLDDASISLKAAFVPLWIWHGFTLCVLGYFVFQFSIGWRIESTNSTILDPTKPKELNSHTLTFLPYRLIRDDQFKNIRLSLTMFTIFMAVIGIIVFEILLSIRSNEVHPSSSSSWPMTIVTIPLVISIGLCLLLSIASSLQMAQQRRAVIDDQSN